MERTIPKIGTKVLMIKGGHGSGGATDLEGVVIKKPYRRPVDYGGEVWDEKAEFYVQGQNSEVWGICKGFTYKVLKS